jgi:hypothetical protein
VSKISEYRAPTDSHQTAIDCLSPLLSFGGRLVSIKLKIYIEVGLVRLIGIVVFGRLTEPNTNQPSQTETLETVSFL